MTSQALAGIKVLELAQGVAGPYASKLFADFGAEVLKIEPPGQGDPGRFLPPLAEGAAPPESSGMFAYLNTNKKSITLDIEADKGADLIRRLSRETDILIESFQPGFLNGLGLGYSALTLKNPDLIYTSVTWYGQEGGYRNFKGNDALINGLSGVSYYIGPKEGPPVLPGGYQTQFVGGVTAFIAAMGALMGRTRGKGCQYVDTSILDANLCFNETGVASFSSSGEPGFRKGLNRFTPAYPASVFPCKDGWIGANVLTPAQWRQLCALTGLPELKDKPEYSTSLLRLEHADELEPLLAEKFLERTSNEWFHQAQARRIPFALVPTMAELLSSTHFKDRQSFVPVNQDDTGTFMAPAIPFKLLKTPALKGGTAPRLGQNNSEVFSHRLGLSESECKILKAEGVL
ncbi:MAG: CaiB/BaiF CoA-transferase family protein [Candidatus Adiutricales bacterium]